MNKAVRTLTIDLQGFPVSRQIRLSANIAKQPNTKPKNFQRYQGVMLFSKNLNCVTSNSQDQCYAKVQPWRKLFRSDGRSWVAHKAKRANGRKRNAMKLRIEQKHSKLHTCKLPATFQINIICLQCLPYQKRKLFDNLEYANPSASTPLFCRLGLLMKSLWEPSCM